MNLRFKASIVLCAALLAPVCEAKKPKTPPAAVAPPPAVSVTAPERVTTVEGITEYRLPNGLRVLLFPDPSKPTITVNITYLVVRAMKATAKPAWRICSSTWCSRAPHGTRTSQTS